MSGKTTTGVTQRGVLGFKPGHAGAIWGKLKPHFSSLEVLFGMDSQKISHFGKGSAVWVHGPSSGYLRALSLITSSKNPKLDPKLESEHLPSVAGAGEEWII